MSTNPYEPPTAFSEDRKTTKSANRYLWLCFTLLNVCGWAVIFLLAPWDGKNDHIFEIIAIILSLPLILFVVPSGHPTLGLVIYNAVVFGINAVLWGHGLAWIVNFIRGVAFKNQT